MADHEHSPAYLVLRPSARRLLAFIGTEIERQGGGTVTIYNDQFEAVGSGRRVYLPGLHELNTLGLIELVRLPKRHLIGLSDGWREITTRKQAMAVSAAAREQRKPVLMQKQPASVSSNAQA